MAVVLPKALVSAGQNGPFDTVNSTVAVAGIVTGSVDTSERTRGTHKWRILPSPACRLLHTTRSSIFRDNCVLARHQLHIPYLSNALDMNGRGFLGIPSRAETCKASLVFPLEW